MQPDPDSHYQHSVLAFGHIPEETPMGVRLRTAVDDSAAYTPWRLTRREALFGAAALLAPLPASVVAAVPGAAAQSSGLIRLDSNENPYGPSPAARRAILASVVDAPRYAAATIANLTSQLASTKASRTPRS